MLFHASQWMFLLLPRSSSSKGGHGALMVHSFSSGKTLPLRSSPTMRSCDSFSRVGFGHAALSFVGSSRSSSSGRAAHGRLPWNDNWNENWNGKLWMTNSVESLESAESEARLGALFEEHSKEGVMSEDQLRAVPDVRELLEDGDLSSEELTEMWSQVALGKKQIDSQQFIELYNAIDDLFEDVQLDDLTDDLTDDLPINTDSPTDAPNQELSQIFADLKTNNNDTLTYESLLQWDEIQSLLYQEKLLALDEFTDIWARTATPADDKPLQEYTMDLNAFLNFNNELDQLFEFDDSEDNDITETTGEQSSTEQSTSTETTESTSAETTESKSAETTESTESPSAKSTILYQEEEQDTPPAVLFSQLLSVNNNKHSNYQLSLSDIQQSWGNLIDMLEDEDLSQEELVTLYYNVKQQPPTNQSADLMMLNEDEFVDLYNAIDELFEEYDEDDNDDDVQSTTKTTKENKSTDTTNTNDYEIKEELLELLQDVTQIPNDDNTKLLCGLDCSELEQERVLEVVADLEKEPYNRASTLNSPSTNDDKVTKQDLVGLWQLIYSSSSTMKYNEGLSGLAGGLTRFGGLQQRLSSTKYLSDVEYIEQVIGKLGEQSFEVKITGDWELRTEISLFTGKPSNVLSVIPDKVNYGPRSDKADHWKSLGPMNLLILAYLDDDLRIMRGSTSTDTLFIFQRV